MPIPVVKDVTGVGSELMQQDNLESLEEVLVKSFRTVSSSDAEQTWTRDTFGEAARDCLSSRLGNSMMGDRDRNHRCRCCMGNCDLHVSGSCLQWHGSSDGGSSGHYE